MFLTVIAGSTKAQLTISGNVYDSTKVIPVKNVLVQSTAGTSAKTDSSGHYDIVVTDKDSLTFIYLNKPTAKFAVKDIQNIGNFDISLRIRLHEKYKMLQEVRVYSKSYQQDSAENREDNAGAFNFQKPGVGSSMSSYSGAAGLDLDEFINIFRFKRNKQMLSLQKRLIEQEQEKYIDYRFNKTLVKRITRLEGTALDSFMIMYRPDYEFARQSTTVEFYQYILNASYNYRASFLKPKMKADQ